MVGIVRAPLKMFNLKTRKSKLIAVKRHELKRINNPFDPDGSPWLVLKDSPNIGQTETAWRNSSIATIEE